MTRKHHFAKLLIFVGALLAVSSGVMATNHPTQPVCIETPEEPRTE